MELTDEMLREAAAEVSKALITSLPAPETCQHRFSRRFRREMRHLLHNAAFLKTQSLLRKTAVAILAVILAISSWLSVDRDARAAFLSWLRIQYENSFIYQYFGTEPKTVLPSCAPTWLPKEYFESSRIGSDLMTAIIYTGPDSDIVFSYRWMSSDTTSEVIPEGAVMEYVTVNGLPGDFYKGANTEDDNLLIWFDENKKLSYSIHSFLDKSVLLRIAESVVSEK